MSLGARRLHSTKRQLAGHISLTPRFSAVTDALHL
jgi:hypothetical protein